MLVSCLGRRPFLLLFLSHLPSHFPLPPREVDPFSLAGGRRLVLGRQAFSLPVRYLSP